MQRLQAYRYVIEESFGWSFFKPSNAISNYQDFETSFPEEVTESSPVHKARHLTVYFVLCTCTLQSTLLNGVPYVQVRIQFLLLEKKSQNLGNC